jgi:ABC-type spermidine/putrescine transport system permease subunit II
MTAPTIAIERPRVRVRTRRRRRLSLGRQLLLQLVCLGIALTVLFPVIWIVGMSLDPRNIARPDSIIPPGASLDAYFQVLAHPTQNPVSFLQLAFNSLLIAGIIAVMSVGLGILSAYAFSRLNFVGREVWMLLVLAILMLPAVATSAFDTAIASRRSTQGPKLTARSPAPRGARATESAPARSPATHPSRSMTTSPRAPA